MAAESGVTRSNIMRTLKRHPYKWQLLPRLSEGDPDRRIESCEWVVIKLDGDANFSSGILFTDEANVYVNGEINRQNVRHCSDTNPHWMNPSKMQGVGKVMVWCGIWGNKIVGPIFFDTNLYAEMYLNMLQDTIKPSLLNEDGEFPAYFQQDECTTSLWYLRAPMVGSAVPGFLDWSPWSC
jgi:hypothetical protein